MLCPNCNSKFAAVKVDNITVQHCSECGATFFEENQINRISADTAEILASKKTADAISSEEKICPADGEVMEPLHQQAIPDHISLLCCPECKGIFAYPNDLVKLKEAQEQKINYYKTHSLPLPSLKTVLVYASFIIVSLSTISLTYLVTNKPHNIESNASQICTPNQIIKTDTGYLFYCKTDTKFRSEIRKVCLDGEKTVPVNDIPSVNHMTTIELNCQYIQMIFYQDKLRIETELIPLN